MHINVETYKIVLDYVILISTLVDHESFEDTLSPKMDVAVKDNIILINGDFPYLWWQTSLILKLNSHICSI